MIVQPLDSARRVRFSVVLILRQPIFVATINLRLTERKTSCESKYKRIQSDGN